MNREYNSSKKRGKVGKPQPLGSGSRDKESVIDKSYKSQLASSSFYSNLSSDKTSKFNRNGNSIIGKNALAIKANRLQRSGGDSTVKKGSLISRLFGKHTGGAPDGKNALAIKDNRLQPSGGVSSVKERSLISRLFGKHTGGAPDGKNASAIKDNRLQSSGSVSRANEGFSSSRLFPKHTGGASGGKSALSIKDNRLQSSGSVSRAKEGTSSSRMFPKHTGGAPVGKNVLAIKNNRLQPRGSVSTGKEGSSSSRLFPKHTGGAPGGKNGTPYIESRLGGAEPLIERSAASTNVHHSLVQSKANLTGNNKHLTASSGSVDHSAATSHDGLSLGRPKVQSSKKAPLTGLKRKAPLPADEKMMASDLSSIGNTTGMYQRMPSRPLTSSDTSVPASKRFRKRSFSKQDFVEGQQLGKGGFGSVVIAKEKKSGFICAIKKISKSKVVENALERPIQREININGAAINPNILQIYTSFADDEFIYLVTEYATQGDLFSKIKSEKKFSDEIAAKYIVQVINALNHLHSSHVIHRDLKPENILLSHDGRVLLADFGWAVQTNNQRKTFVGTPDYMAPELVEGCEYGPSVDCWALGVLAYELLVGTPPFKFPLSGGNCREAYDRILRVDLEFPTDVSPLAVDFITKLLKKNQNERMSLSDAANHKWLVSFARNS